MKLRRVYREQWHTCHAMYLHYKLLLKHFMKYAAMDNVDGCSIA